MIVSFSVGQLFLHWKWFPFSSSFASTPPPRHPPSERLSVQIFVNAIDLWYMCVSSNIYGAQLIAEPYGGGCLVQLLLHSRVLIGLTTERRDAETTVNHLITRHFHYLRSHSMRFQSMIWWSPSWAIAVCAVWPFGRADGQVDCLAGRHRLTCSTWTKVLITHIHHFQIEYALWLTWITFLQ